MRRDNARALDLGLDRLFGPTYRFQRAIRQLQDSVMPRSLRTVLDIRDRAHPASATNVLGLANLDSLHAGITSHDRLLNSMSAVTDVLRRHDFAPTALNAGGLAHQVRDMLGPQIAWSALPTLKLAESLAGVVPQPTHLLWQQHLVKSITPSFELLSNWSARQVGLLAFMHEPEMGASLSWISHEEERLKAAALMPEGRRLPKIAIETVVSCCFCDAELIQNDQTLRWRGNRLRLEITVVPICASCLENTDDYTEYLEDALDELLRPPLRLLHTGGQSDGVRRGSLRLVTSDEGDELDDSDRE